MDAIDEQKVVTCDIPGAFLQDDWPADQDCYLEFENVMVDMICQIDSKYIDNVICRGSKKFIFAKLNKAMYGTLLGAGSEWICVPILPNVMRWTDRGK
jgi:hypothetical protein